MEVDDGGTPPRPAIIGAADEATAYELNTDSRELNPCISLFVTRFLVFAPLKNERRGACNSPVKVSLRPSLTRAVATAPRLSEISPIVRTPSTFSTAVTTSRAIETGLVVRAFAPGSTGNIGPGLDILGCALTGPGDAVRARLTVEPGVRVDEPGHPDLTRDPNRHASAIAAAEVLRRAGARVGIVLSVEKGLPLSGGQGGSAASAVAGALATNTLLGSPLDQDELLRAALVAEERLAGRHIDNLAPALFGGIVLIRSIDPSDIIRLPVPANLRVVIVHPQMLLRTTDARAVLPATIDRATAIAQAAAVATIVAALYSDDLSRLRGAIDDRIAEPARTPLLPGFAAAKAAALAAGALGSSISGGGPSAFALVDGDTGAAAVMDAMVAAYEAHGVTASGRVAGIDEVGARIEEVNA
jgi:homoserine kinase